MSFIYPRAELSSNSRLILSEVRKSQWWSSNWNSSQLSNGADKCHTSLSCTVIELHSYHITLTCNCKYTVHIAPLFKGTYGNLPPVTDQLYSIHPKKGLWPLDITNQLGYNQKKPQSSYQARTLEKSQGLCHLITECQVPNQNYQQLRMKN